MKKVAKIILKILLAFVVFFLLVVLALQIPFVQNFVKNKAIVYLEEKIKTKVEIGSIEIGLPKKIILKDFYFEDQSKDTLLAGKALKIDISLFQLFNNKVEINDIDLEGITANIKSNKDSVYNFDYIIKAFESSKPESDDEPMEISVKEIDLNNIKFTYENTVSNLNTKIQFEDLNITVKTIDLEKQNIVIKSIELDKTKGQLILTKSDKITEETPQNPSNLPWRIDVLAISISDFNFEFDNNNELKTQKGIDFNHLKINNLSLQGESLTIDNDAYSGTIDVFTFNEKSGFQLDELSTVFNYTSKSASLENVSLKTPQTTLQNKILVTYPSIESLSENLESLTIDTDLKNSKIGFKDVLLLVPELNSNDIFKNNPNAIVNFNANVKGKLDDLKIDTFNASGIGNTKVVINGTITGLPNVDNSVFDINILNFESSSKDIYTFAPKNTIPNTIQLPESIYLKGDFKGGVKAFETNMDLKSSLGNANVEGTFDQSRKGNEKYKVDAVVDDFDLGKFIKNNQFGKVTAKVSINGRNLDPSTATTKLTSKIVKVRFNQYDYNNITIDGNIDNGLFVTNVSSTDPNLNFALDANGSSNLDKPTLDLKLNLELVDLNKLNLHAGSLKIKGDITANFEDLNPDNLNGIINANNFLVALEKEQFPLDTISARAISNVEKDSIILKSQFANGLITGDYKLSTISNQLINSISKYYQLGEEYVPNQNNQNLDFEFVIKDNAITKKIIPELTELSEITLKGSYNSINDSIVINASIPQINYANNELSNGVLKVNTQDNTLLYDLNFNNIKNKQFEIPKTTLKGKLEDNTVDYELNIKDAKSNDKYIISGVYKDSLDASTISFNPEKLLLNYEDWEIDETNQIKLAKNGILVSNFKIQNKEQSFSIQSENNEINSPITANFESFKLESLTNIAKSNFEIGGMINGQTTIKNLMSTPLFVADLDIENFRIKKDTVGDLVVKLDNETANFYSANITLKGFENDLNINGNYNISNESLDFNVDVKKLKIKSLQSFTLDNLRESGGYLNGTLEVSGKASNPNVDGNIKFNSVGFKLVPLNSKFNLLNDNIVFNTNKILFKDFKLQDDNGNPLRINGTIDSKDFTNLGFDLNVVANNFKAVNSNSKDNDLFYGELYLDNNLGIKGTLGSPIIDGTIKINGDTKFTIVLPQSDPSIADREGIVEFIDQDQPVLITVDDPTKQISQTEVKGIDASVNIVVDKEAEISIIIDEANGDYLKLQGEAELTGGIGPSGKTTLTGKYEFTGGAYEMNFNLINRKFEIQPESYILWTGEPTAANINITAVYKVEASPLDLVDDQLVGLTAETRNTYKQRIPFETNLIMKGELLQPEITFDIILPEGNNNVSTEIINTTQAKLEQIRRDEDALNKQVFALLLLNRFIGENPFESGSGGTSGTYLAKQSVSKILSQQLNNLAGDLIKGFELDFDLEATEDYSSGEKEERTDLNVGLSKQLLNDRLKVTVGSSFGIEGEGQEKEQTTNIAGDVTADYLITKDGRYKLRAYRKNNYQVALQGQVIETGVAFIITMNYDKFRELFHSKRKDNRKNKNKDKNDNQ